MHHSHNQPGLPPLQQQHQQHQHQHQHQHPHQQQQQQQQQPHPQHQHQPHLQHQRPLLNSHNRTNSPHQPHPSQTNNPQGPYASPQIASHSLSHHQSAYGASHSGATGASQQDVPYYAHPSPYSTNSAAGSYSSSEPSIDPSGMATTMNPRYQGPPIPYHTPQSASPASVQSPQHDQHGRPMGYQPMYSYPPYSMAQQSPYAQHPVTPQTGSMNPGYMPQQTPQALSQHPSHPVTPAMTSSPVIKTQPQAQIQQRQPSMMSPASQPSAGPATGGSSGIKYETQGPQGNSAINPSAAPGPIPATTPLVVRQDQNGVQWIAFEYSRDRVKMEYTIRCDVESVNADTLPQEFRTENCVYPRACCPKDQYKGNRLHYETECNTVGWALAQLNPCLRGKRGLIQRAVDSWRNSNQDPRLRSRRVRRMAKVTTRKAVAAQHGNHMAIPGAPPVTGMPAPGLPAAPPRQPTMSMAGPGMIHHHHEQSGGPAGPDDVSGNDYHESSHTHHHQAPTGPGAPNDIRQTHNFYPQYPQSQGVTSGLPHSSDGSGHVGAHAAPHAVSTSTSRHDEDAQDNIALFGDLPEAKRRKFILVDDPQRGTRVRVRVMLDQVRMHEMPDSYRKNNSVFPRSWFPTEMQSPPPSPRRGRWPEDVDAEEAGPAETRTLVPVPLMDGSETKLSMPRMTRTKRSRETTLNDLGYRMSWSQSRVFSGRTLFLQRSLDAYRNKMRSTMVAAGQDVAQVAPHFETRVGKRKWLERSKKTKRDASP